MKDMSKVTRASVEARRTAKTTDETGLLGGLDATGDSRQAILKRVENMPVTCRKTYLRAMTGKSRTAAMKSFCRMCVGWQSKRQIADCTDPACPLYPYRPFREKKAAS